MPSIVSDIVDVYVFRRLNARVQFLLLQRRTNVPLGNTWQSFHTQIQGPESTIAAARRAVTELAGLNISEVYSADYINEFYDDARDVVVLAPVLAVNVSPQAPITLGAELREAAWWDTNQAVARLPFAGQRWAVRHIDEIMSVGHAESQLYRLHLPVDMPDDIDDSLPVAELDDPIEPAVEPVTDPAIDEIETIEVQEFESDAAEPLDELHAPGDVRTDVPNDDE